MGSRNSRPIKKANHGKRPASHNGRWKKRIKTPRR